MYYTISKLSAALGLFSPYGQFFPNTSQQSHPSSATPCKEMYISNGLRNESIFFKCYAGRSKVRIGFGSELSQKKGEYDLKVVAFFSPLCTLMKNVQYFHKAGILLRKQGQDPCFQFFYS